jgi:hypothetical protein
MKLVGAEFACTGKFALNQVFWHAKAPGIKGT